MNDAMADGDTWLETGSFSVVTRLAHLFPPQGPQSTRIALAIYRLLARQDRAAPEAIAAAAQVTTADVTARLETWPGVYRDRDGAVIGFWGLTGHRMPHCFTVAGRERFTWCAWDALFIPELIDETALVHSNTPVDQRKVELRVSPHGAEPLDDGRPLHVSFRLPRSEDWEAEVVATFCHHVTFLYQDEVDRWMEQNPDGVTLSLADAFRAGKLKNAHQFQR